MDSASRGEASPVLLFSNLWQGHLVTALGWPFGRPGYGVYLMGAQLAAMTASAALLCRLNGHVALNISLVAVIGLRPLMAPQFTLTAGSLCIAGLLAFRVQIDRPNPVLPALGAALLLLGFLMREQMALAMVALAMPALLCRALLRSVPVWVAAFCAVLLAVHAQLDHAAALAGPAWAAFREINLPRAAFTDFDILPRVIGSPAALVAAGWSENDVWMVRLFWLMDPGLATPVRAPLDLTESKRFPDAERI